MTDETEWHDPDDAEEVVRERGRHGFFIDRLDGEV